MWQNFSGWKEKPTFESVNAIAHQLIENVIGTFASSLFDNTRSDEGIFFYLNLVLNFKLLTGNSLLKQIMLNVSAGNSSSIVEMHSNVFSETRWVIVANRFCVSKCFEDLKNLYFSVFSHWAIFVGKTIKLTGLVRTICSSSVASGFKPLCFRLTGVFFVLIWKIKIISWGPFFFSKKVFRLQIAKIIPLLTKSRRKTTAEE